MSRVTLFVANETERGHYRKALQDSAWEKVPRSWLTMVSPHSQDPQKFSRTLRRILEKVLNLSWVGGFSLSRSTKPQAWHLFWLVGLEDQPNGDPFWASSPDKVRIELSVLGNKNSRNFIMTPGAPPNLAICASNRLGLVEAQVRDPSHQRILLDFFFWCVCVCVFARARVNDLGASGHSRATSEKHSCWRH